MVSLKYLMDKRSRSSVPQFRCRVPAKVVGRLRGMKVLLHLSSQLGPAYIKVVTIGTDVAFSLGESDERIAKARHVDALEHLQRLFDMTAAGPVSLSHKDMVALSGEAYRLYQEVHGNDPGEPDVWAYHKAFHRAAIEGRIPSTPPATLKVNEAALAKELFGTGNLTEAINAFPAGQYNVLEDRFGLLTDYVLIRHRIHLVPEDRERLLRLVGTASLDAGWQLKRNAEGDYSPDPKAIRFPPVETVTAAKRKQTITGLLDLWWKEAKATGRTQSTYDTYKGAIDRLVKHLDHDDASRLTEANMLEYKDARLKVVTAKTFKDGDPPQHLAEDVSAVSLRAESWIVEGDLLARIDVGIRPAAARPEHLVDVRARLVETKAAGLAGAIREDDDVLGHRAPSAAVNGKTSDPAGGKPASL